MLSQGSVYAESLLDYDVPSTDTISQSVFASDVQSQMQSSLSSQNNLNLDAQNLNINGRLNLKPD